MNFTDKPYVDALREGQRHDRIMEEVLAIPDIENKWDGVEVEKLALGMLKSV